MPEGGRKEAYKKWFDNQEEEFQARILPIQLDVMKVWGTYCSMQKSKGQLLSILDSLIAASALYYDLIVVTRNVGDFPDVPVFNPWE